MSKVTKQLRPARRPHLSLAARAQLDGSNFADADFNDAQLADTRFGTANLKNANFTNANIKSADLRQAENLTLKQLRQACVWPQGTVEESQPKVSDGLTADLAQAGGIKACQDTPFLRWLARKRVSVTRALSSFW
jgi:hypothetical protein